MANNEYIERLNQVIFPMHKAVATHVETVTVREVFNGKVIWDGQVELFDLLGHPRTERAYAWSHRAGKNDSDERFIAVLGLPPVTSAESAVKVAFAAEVKGAK